MAADAARNILKNKKETKVTKRDAPDKTTGGSRAGNRKKPKTTTITEAVATLPDEDDANDFELASQTEAEEKKLLEAKNLREAKQARQGHVKALNAKPKTDAMIMRDAIRNQPERLKAAKKKTRRRSVFAKAC
jgi:hypothetical protein